MKNYKINSAILFIAILFLGVSCANNPVEPKPEKNTNLKSQKLAQEVFKNGKLKNILKMISAKEVKRSLDSNILIIDLRRPKDFASGHINNSVNLKMSELADYAQVRGLQMYDKVIMVCYTGQSASYSTGILQMLGHKNLYVLKWGMCSWNKKFNKRWLKNLSDLGEPELTSVDFKKNESTELPLIKSKKNSGKEILQLRARMLLKEGFGKATVNANFLIANIKKSYIICYQAEEQYKKAHLKSAVFYSPENSLSLATDLLTLPTEKSIGVYSNNGHSSSYITSILRMLGYDAKTIKYGANSFMNSKITNDGFGFENETQNFPTKSIKYIEVEGVVQEGGC